MLSRQRIEALRGINTKCADCSEAKGLDWVSVQMGAVLCVRCAGKHRGLGCAISRIKSLEYDTWRDSELSLLEGGGNRRAWRRRRCDACPDSAGVDAYACACADEYRAELAFRVLGVAMPGERSVSAEPEPLKERRYERQCSSDSVTLRGTAARAKHAPPARPHAHAPPAKPHPTSPHAPPAKPHPSSPAFSTSPHPHPFPTSPHAPAARPHPNSPPPPPSRLRSSSSPGRHAPPARPFPTSPAATPSFSFAFFGASPTAVPLGTPPTTPSKVRVPSVHFAAQIVMTSNHSIQHAHSIHAHAKHVPR